MSQGTSALLSLRVLMLYFLSFNHGRAWFIWKFLSLCSMSVQRSSGVSAGQDLSPLLFFLEKKLGFSFGKFFSTVSQVVLPCPGLKKTKLGNSDPFSEEFEPWVTWHKLTWGELTHLRRRTMKSLATIPNTQILTIPDIPTLTFKFPWFSEISSSNSVHKKHTERLLKIKWWRSILEKQIPWV